LKFAGTVNAVVEGHDAGEYTPRDMGPKESVPSGDRRRQKTGVCASQRLRVVPSSICALLGPPHGRPPAGG
jgi:hypothetical protein